MSEVVVYALSQPNFRTNAPKSQGYWATLEHLFADSDYCARPESVVPHFVTLMSNRAHNFPLDPRT